MCIRDSLPPLPQDSQLFLRLVPFDAVCVLDDGQEPLDQRRDGPVRRRLGRIQLAGRIVGGERGNRLADQRDEGARQRALARGERPGGDTRRLDAAVERLVICLLYTSRCV